jgi:hypothetical protein
MPAACSRQTSGAEKPGGCRPKRGFQIARRALNSNVESRQIGVLGLSPETVGVFDLVLFLGVLYHMRHPLLALEKVFSVTGKQLILETHIGGTVSDVLLYDKNG